MEYETFYQGNNTHSGKLLYSQCLLTFLTHILRSLVKIVLKIFVTSCTSPAYSKLFMLCSINSPRRMGKGHD